MSILVSVSNQKKKNNFSRGPTITPEIVFHVWYAAAGVFLVYALFFIGEE